RSLCAILPGAWSRTRASPSSISSSSIHCSASPWRWSGATMSEAARSPEVGGGDPPLVEIRDLKKSYGSVAAVRGVSLTVKRGDAQFIIGPSGCGKSTFLRCLNLLEEPPGGSLRVASTTIDFDSGRHLSAREQARFRSDVGMVCPQRSGERRV